MVGVVFRREIPMGTLIDLRHVSEVGRIPGHDAPGHRDGWGMVSFMNGSPRYIGRSSRWAYQDPSFDAALKEVTKVPSPNILIAHVRALSVGEASLPNTHPFVMDELVLAHNGTVEGFRPRTRHKPKGVTDSELLLARLADLMDEKKDLEAALKSLIVDDISKLNFSAAILLVSDGKRLCGYRDYAPGKPSEYYDLRISRGDDCVVLYQESTVPHDSELPGLRKGELVVVENDLSIRREMLR